MVSGYVLIGVLALLVFLCIPESLFTGQTKAGGPGKGTHNPASHD
jgi:hypothetical protein